jgi:adenosylcobinamide-phosphate synthase
VNRRAGHLTGAGLGLLLDRALGEPPLGVNHPVARFGQTMNSVESRWWADSRARGMGHAVVGIALGLTSGALVRSTAVATGMATGGRALCDAAVAISAPLHEGRLADARELLPTLVGRDPSDLDEKEIARAVVESVAENTVDAIVAPAFWASIAGAPGALVHRAVNTMDAMVGYRGERYERYGWASARLDDVMAWVPARLTAVLVVAVRPAQAGAVWQAVRNDARHHPSPNAGVAEAAFAAALGVQLGGVNRYPHGLEERAMLGDGRPPEADDIGRAVALSRDVTLALAGGLIALGAVLRRRRR